MTDRAFTVKEIEKMATDLTIKTPQTLDKIWNKALTRMVERARLLAEQEHLEGELANNNVIDIHEGGKKK